MPDDETDYDARAADRLILFSDAVVAIAITLLAIDLPLPEGGTVSEFWASVRHDSTHYLAFLISFFVIAAQMCTSAGPSPRRASTRTYCGISTV